MEQDLNHITEHLGMEPLIPPPVESTDPITLWRKRRARKRRARRERKAKERSKRSKGWS